MGDAFEIVYDALVLTEDLLQLGRVDLERIKRAIETKLMHAPDIYGKPLRGPLHGYWSLRVGQIRIAFHIKKRTVYIDAIEHRGTVYETLSSRAD